MSKYGSTIYNQRNHKSTTHHTPKIPTARLLCECDIYTSIYDNDPQMKEVMENFIKQTQPRFEEYDERMKTTRQKCKEQCDKEIQKIILKDKLEKQMEEQLTTLETKIDTNDIPTCVCEKSLADKVEKGCLKCGYGLGTVAPTVGLIGSVAVHAWKPKALEVAIAAALKANATKISVVAEAAGELAGKEAVIAGLKELGLQNIADQPLVSYFTTTPFNKASIITKALFNDYVNICVPRPTGSGHLLGTVARDPICESVWSKFVPIGSGLDRNAIRNAIEIKVESMVSQAKDVAGDKVAEVTAAKELVIETAQKEAIEIASYNWYTTIGYSVLAILIIVLIMVIIYLILRYRRKKKMKKKLQYIKLLEE
ncbi:hypothetical protein PFUGPA_02244 [Plasmodium falciparum Palo Alto/Uganda]|uniref:Rifin n=1 Tax=Plasmodium falciparum (isolate Palo Alto / Uganda) TaxID=57270 RepID=W4J0Q9_PLAFP|nr:hypothetical protein PFUGPA_02244 [Plasmodium falciparum Palo Alto/Uganda]